MLEDQGLAGNPTWRLHTTTLFRALHSTNISTLGERTNLKQGEPPSLFIVYITIS